LVPDSQRGSDRDTLERVTGKQPGAQVLLVERLDAGRASLTLWDQSARRPSNPRIVQCASGCLEPLSQAAAELQDLCFDSGCAGKQPRELRPAGDCEPFSAAVCADLPELSASKPPAPSGIAPGRAKTLLALTGAGVGLSVAATLGLWIADRTVVLKNVVVPTGVPVSDMTKVEITTRYPYTPVAITATVVSAAILGVSIPAFYWLGQAAAASPVNGKASDPSAVPPGPSPPGVIEPSGLLQCPAARLDVAKKPPPGSRMPG